HPAVHTAVVLVREDQPGDRRLVAYVVVEEQATVDQPSLMTHLRPLVPSYMVPAAIVVLDELPLNRSGKVDRRALPAPDLDADRAVYVAPRTPTEAVVANAIAAVLGVERVGVHDEFFALGGHSLLATRLISRLRTDLDVELPLRQVFATPDVAGLATAIEQAAGRVALPSIVATPREAAADGTVALPLSFAQERLWFLAQLDPESPAYNIPAPVRLRGALDVDALRAALTAVVTRHEVLRTVFRAGDETPVQVVLPATEVPLPVIDVASEAELFSHLRDEVSTAFDLEAGPLLRARLYHLGPDENVLLLNVHHIVYDGWSVGVLIRELGAHFAGLESRLPTLEVQYGDVAVWQREHLATSVDEQVAWWRTQLAGVPVLSLPTDRPRPPVQTFAGASLDFTVPAATSTALEDLARSHGATLFMVLHAGVSALLARWSGQDDFAIGSPIANRTRAEMEPLIGFFVNTLVLRTDLADDPSFVTLLERSKHTTLEAYGRQDVPFERLVAELSPTRDMAHTPLFQVLLILQNMARQTTTAEAAPSEFGALTLEPVRVGSTTAKFDVTLSFGEHPEGLRGQIEWNTDLFDRGTIERLIGQLVRLFTAVVETPETTVSALRLHDDAERHRLLVAYNDTTRDYPRDATVLDLVRARADATPDKIAVHAEGDDEGLSYRALIDRVHRVANKLRTLGVGPETLTGIYLERSADLVVATLAVHAAGGGYVPLDPAFPTARLAYVAEDAGLRAVITESALADDVPVAEEVPRFEIDTAKLGRTSKTAPAVPTRSDGLAYVIYTSGSTGKPKGVAIQHQALVNFLVTMADAPGLGVDDVLVALTTLSFDISGLELFLPLITGAQVVVANRETASDGARLGALLTTSGATVVQATPATWRLLLDSGWRPAPGLKVLCGGEALPRELADQLLAAGVELWNVYGPTETTIWSTCHRVEAGAGIPSIGRPIANTTIYTLDRHLEPTPIGVPGALMIGGDGLARGYYGRPALTAERFVPDPFAATPGARLYHTGDLARWRGDGTLDFLGRSDFQVKVRGFRIELGEIETVLDRHPAIARAVVNAVGSGADTALAAYLIVEADDGLPATSDLRRHLKESLPDYMVPAHYVELDAFPLTPNGKVDRRALPEPSREAALAAYVAPRTPTEVAVANAIATVLGVEKVGVHDDFFALGGHSLLATRFLARLRAELDVDLPLRQVFATPDVAGLALAVENAERVVLPPLEPVPRDRPVPATFAQERQWFLDRFRPGDTSYNLVNTLQLGSAIEHEALQAALDATVARHEILRTTFQAGDKAPVQVIHERLEIPVVFEDLRQLAPDEAATAVEAHANQERRRVFDLATGPLLALRLLRVADERSMLVLNMHHIISDGWSMMVLMREIAARMAGQTPPPLAVQIADVAVWQREHLTPVFADEIDWWREHLDGLEPLDLPTDRPRPAIFDSAGATVSYDIDAATVDGLRELAQSEGATLFMAMHAVVASLLGRWADQDDLALASPIAGRNHPDMEPLIGFFANTLVLRHDLSGRPTFRELLARVRHVALGVFDHQNLPFERLVEALGVRRDPSSTPVFQAAVVLQNMADRELALPALQGELVEREGGSAKIDLTWYFQEHAGGLRVLMEYRSSIFASGTMGRMVEQLAELMRGVTASPDRQIAELAVLGAAEERRLLEWSGRASRCLGGLVDSVMAQALAVPDAEAVLDTVGGTLTRAELVSRAHALATRLHLHGIGVEEPVVLFCARSLDMVVATVGILGAGCVVVPLDPAYPDDRIAWILEDTGARLAVVDEVGLARLPAASTVERLPLASLAAPASEPVDLGSLTWPGVTGPDHIAHILYTSGSTGRPKGVMVTHANVQQRIVRDPEAADVIGEQTYLQISSPAFDGSTVEIWPPLLGGGRLVMAPPGPLSLDAIGRTVREHQVSMLFFTTSLYNQVVDSQLGALTGVRQLFMGGEAASPTHCQRALDELGATVINGYGPTENTCFTTCHVMRPGDRIPAHTVPIGRAAAGTTIYVLDAHLSPTPIGVPGELYTGGGGLARGYLNRADLTADRFVPDPFASPAGGRLYRTGDKVRWLDDGTLEFLGRVDRQIKLRGYRIEPGEIEAEILAHAAVREAVVTVFGEGAERRLVAYYVLDTGVEVAEDALLEQVKTSLPAYMVPSTFMRLDALPLTSNGKLDRKALPVPLLERRGDRTAPSTALEASIAEVWRGVLGLDDVGVEESFFDLGGNSLLMVEVHGRLQQTLGARAPSMVELFRLPTIRSLAESLDDAAVAPRLAEVTASARRGGPVDIAVVGMAARFPGADDLETFWRNLAAGVESVSFYDEETLLASGVPRTLVDNPRYVRARSRIADTDHFDASFFGMSPREAQIVDPQHRMFLETSWSALEDAGYGDTSQPQHVGVWAGAGMPTYLFNVLSNQALAASVGIFQIFLANDKDFLPTRVSYKLNLTGPSLTVQTACSTALVSVSLACDALAAGQCRMALAGGVASKNGGETGYLHETGGISSPDGHTRAFDARGGGTVFGDGVGVVVLKRLDDALADGDHIRAVIRGTALNNDGSAKVGFTAPSIDGQAAVIAQAHAEADVDPRSITYIEAHGTATNLGDPVEVSALTSAFAAHTDDTGFCAIGSVKSNFGHLDTAAGAAGLIKTVLALEHKSLPPSLHYETPNPHIDFASSPFFVNTELRDWQPGSDGVRRAGVSSFGMGGTNAHVVLEEAPAATESAPTASGQLLVVSAPTPTALATITTRLADHLDGLASLPADADSRRLADVAYTLAVGRRPFNHRRVVVAADTASAVTALRASAPSRHTDTVRNPVFLFAGQGSQYPGMARDLYEHQPVFREALDGCAEVLERHLGRDLRTVIFADADDASAATTLTDTRFTQPALFAVCWALSELLESWGVVPTAMLGHSLGEWVAATRAGVFSRDDALALVAKRGALMASMEPGSMVSIEATEDELADFVSEELVVAVVNGPRQTVLAGPDEAIEGL
ncbi:MAG: amino acid adenylation domain-containing protein, partial [Acidobacteriota bacterium]